MNELLNNFYGIYPTWIENNIFQFQNQRFCLVDCYLSEKQLCQLLEINQLVINQMGQGGYRSGIPGFPTIQQRTGAQHWIFALPARAARARGAGKIT